ncbi:MAG: flagellar hook-basal body complex protein FliE [Deltaproteobacteria bacterium]|nr:flagellar hook-basal body complex protein FliE [Deltaproteobacteria bacterium]
MAVGPVDPSLLPLARPLGTEGLRLPAPSAETGGFGELLEAAVARAATSGHAARTAAADLAAGRSDDIHGTMISLQKASIETKLVANVRTKVVDAFYELWRMSI